LILGLSIATAVMIGAGMLALSGIRDNEKSACQVKCRNLR
jgi:hypothetical protein